MADAPSSHCQNESATPATPAPTSNAATIGRAQHAAHARMRPKGDFTRLPPIGVRLPQSTISSNLRFKTNRSEPMHGGVQFAIGATAERSGLSVPTIRYYEEIGLLPRAGRREGGHRVYGEGDFRRLIFIAHCRDLGFSIERIRSLLAVTLDNRPCADARHIAKSHLLSVKEKIAELNEIKRHLDGFIRRCAVACPDNSSSNCVMIDDLSNRAPRRRRRPDG